MSAECSSKRVAVVASNVGSKFDAINATKLTAFEGTQHSSIGSTKLSAVVDAFKAS